MELAPAECLGATRRRTDGGPRINAPRVALACVRRRSATDTPRALCEAKRKSFYFLRRTTCSGSSGRAAVRVKRTRALTEG